MEAVAFFRKDRRRRHPTSAEDERPTVPAGEYGRHLLCRDKPLYTSLPERGLPGQRWREVAERDTQLVHMVSRGQSPQATHTHPLIAALLLKCGEKHAA